MARTPLLNLRVNVETKARWQDAATARGYGSLSEFVRECVEEELESPALVGEGHQRDSTREAETGDG